MTVTFNTQLDNVVATKAAADNDGLGTSVNRCILEVYHGDVLFNRMYAPVTEKEGDIYGASFTLAVVSNRTYTVAFWADCVDNSGTELGLLEDKYYTTTSLKAISLNGTYAGNEDKRDAFFHHDSYTVTQSVTTFDDIQLKRPFAQINVITTDWETVSKGASLKPEKVNVTINSPFVLFNAFTGESSSDSGVTSLSYEAALYKTPASGSEATLSMDYIFASSEQGVIDITFVAKKTDNADVTHTFSYVPYQRNYRTNIKGDLLTSVDKWEVALAPTWETPDLTPSE